MIKAFKRALAAVLSLSLTAAVVSPTLAAAENYELSVQDATTIELDLGPGSTYSDEYVTLYAYYDSSYYVWLDITTPDEYNFTFYVDEDIYYIDISGYNEDGNYVLFESLTVSLNGAVVGGYTPVKEDMHNGHLYELYNGMHLTWDQAEEYCENIGGHLATITDQDEYDFITDFRGSYCYLWIGGYRDDDFNWYWVTGELWDFCIWDSGQPDNSGGDENKLTIWPDGWNDLGNDDRYTASGGFICEYEQGENISLSITDEAGNEITEGYSVSWYKSGSSSVIATGTTLRGAQEDVVYMYTVSLDESLSFTYYAPSSGTVSVGDTPTVTLEAVSDITISGTILGDNNKALAGANIVLTQTNNGYSKEISLETAADGSYSATVANVSTTLLASYDGYYNVTKTIISSMSDAGSVDSGNIIMTLLPDEKISMTITVTGAAVSGSEGDVTSITSTSGLDFALYNKTQSKQIDDFTVQYPSIILGSGMAEGADEIEITASDSNGTMTAEAVTVTLDSSGSGSAEINFIKNGNIKAVPSGGSSTLMMVFDADGVLADKAISSSLITSSALPAGKYSVVFMQKTSLISSVSNFDKLKEYGLVEDDDYTLKTVEIENGIISDMGEVEVPEFDETRLYYTDNDFTSVTCNKATVTAGNFVTIRAEYQVQDTYSTSEQYVIIEIPDGLQFVEGSVTLDGKLTSYSYENNLLTVYAGSDSAVVRFYTIPEESGTYTVEGLLSFTYDNAAVKQPIGSAAFSAEAMTVNIPSKTSAKTVTASGVTKSKSVITLYDNGEEMGTVTANSAGNWSLTFDLPDTEYAFSYHIIQAIVTNESYGTEITTDEQILIYNENLPQVSKVTMYNTAHPTTSLTPVEYTTVFDFTAESTTPSYRYWPSYPTFTFKVEFDNGASNADDVYVITKNTAGEETNIKCTYDSNADIWLGTYDYTSDNVPQSVSVRYNNNVDYTPECQIERILSEGEVEEAWFEFLAEYGEENLEFDILTDEEDYTIITLIDGPTSSAIGYVVFEYLDYADIDLTDEAYQSLNDDNTLFYALAEVDGNIYVRMVDSENEVAFGYMPITDTDIDEDEDEAEETVLSVQATKKNLLNLDKNTLSFLRSAAVTVTKTGVDTGGNLIDGETLADAAYNAFVDNVPTLAAVVDSYWYYYMRNALAKYKQDYSNYARNCLDPILNAKCPDGSYKLSAEDMESLFNTLQAQELYAKEQYDNATEELDNFRKRVRKSALQDLFAQNYGRYLRWFLKMGFKKTNSKNAKYFVYYISANVFSEDLEMDPEEAEKQAKLVKDGITTIANIYDDDIFQAVYQEVADRAAALDKAKDVFPIAAFEAEQVRTYIEGTHNTQMKQLGQIAESALGKMKSCGDKSDNIPIGTEQTPEEPMTTIHDPSGYVCEAVPSNRVEGVTATAYTLTDALDEFGEPTGEQEATVWYAEDYDQVNPLTTDANGEYAWDVPEGQWQVKYEKDGYITAYSDWLPVPPPQTEVHVALVSEAAPEVKSVNAYTDSIRIEFTQYMDIDSVNTNNVTVTLNGTAVSGSIKPLNAEQSFDDENTMYASIFEFIPNTDISDEVKVNISGAVNYASNAMQSAYGEQCTVYTKPESISAPTSETISYGAATRLSVQVLPQEAGANKTLTVTSSSPSIASVTAGTVTTNSDGVAEIVVNGNLPGSAVLTFALDGSDITASTELTVSGVSTQSYVCSKVKASIASGTTVTAGTTVTLTTDTEGAQIYYTLDKTCPCVVDSESRILYTEPIAITEDMYIIAYAVKDGYEDSSTSQFIYTVEDDDPGTLTGNTIIAAGYAEDGTLLNFTIVTAAEDDADISLDVNSKTAYVKIMVWESLSSMCPVYDTIVQKLK